MLLIEHIYFDGDAEVLEYLIWLYKKDTGSGVVQNESFSLVKKYPLSFSKNKKQESFLRSMDQITKWVPLPFRRSLENLSRRRHQIKACNI